MAQNNIVAYQEILQDSQQANNVLRLSVKDLNSQKDILLSKLDSVSKKLNIKPKQINTAATQTQVLYVNDGKGVGGNLVEILKDTIYKDSIQYNNLTNVYYTIGKDSVNIAIDLKNTQYLYIYQKKEYKNNKTFLKRLLTLDFKKINRYKYEIVNTNELLKSKDIRVVEYTQK